MLFTHEQLVALCNTGAPVLLQTEDGPIPVVVKAHRRGPITHSYTVEDADGNRQSVPASAFTEREASPPEARFCFRGRLYHVGEKIWVRLYVEDDEEYCWFEVEVDPTKGDANHFYYRNPLNGDLTMWYVDDGSEDVSARNPDQQSSPAPDNMYVVLSRSVPLGRKLMVGQVFNTQDEAAKSSEVKKANAVGVYKLAAV